MMSRLVPKKRFGLFRLAILLLLLGGVALLVGSSSPAIRAIGIVACIVSVYLVRISNVHTQPNLPITPYQGPDSKTASGAGRLVWAVGIVLLPIAGVSFFYLYQDALNGYNEMLPVYVFAAVGLVCTLVWSYLVSKVL